MSFVQQFNGERTLCSLAMRRGERRPLRALQRDRPELAGAFLPWRVGDFLFRQGRINFSNVCFLVMSLFGAARAEFLRLIEIDMKRG